MARMGEIRNVYRISVGKPERKRPFGINLKTECEVMD
jgi:hypothetical protein